jgi:class 3 adenylate cyclase/predicted ATPase
MNFEDRTSHPNELKDLNRALEALEAQRSILGNEVTDIAQASIREKLARLHRGIRGVDEPQERKLITVLFADVSGFTAMAESMDHEIVNTVINSLWSRVDKAIQEYGGRIDKHIGDAVMGLFGTPIAREDDAERAIRAALLIQAEVQEWKQEFSDSIPNLAAESKKIHLRIGINTGPALLGTVGTIGEYTAIGNTVNVSSRLQAAAPTDGILVSHETYQHVRGIFETTTLEPIQVKGKREPIQVYTINGVKPRAFRVTTRGVEGIETRTIGREEELGKMHSAFRQVVEQRQLHLVNIVAEAGTGKSRLLYEFTKWLEVQTHPIHLFKGRATHEQAQIPFALLRNIFSFSFGIQDNDSAAVARQKLESGIRSYINDEETTTLYTHFIGHLIGMDFSTSPHLRGILGDARQIHDLAFHYALQFFTSITQRQVGIIFLEDIHWADRGSLDFFQYLMKSKPDLQLLIIGLTRSTLFEERPDWGAAPVQTLRLDLLPLSEENCRRLVQEILQKVPVVPPALTELIATKAEGSPFYVEELVKVLIDKGVIVRGEEQWRVEMERFSELRVPDTLTGLLQARLDSLNTSARERLQQASVVGRIFWTGVVERMQNPETQSAKAATPITETLGTLSNKELIFQYGEVLSGKIPEFIFKNAILHDVTYESVLLRLRRIYHLQAAEGLIWLWGERVTEYAGRVGEHYEQAGELLKAADWYAQAGRQAQATYEPDTAVLYYQRALDFLATAGRSEQIPLQLEIHARLGEVLNWQAQYTDAAGKYAAMLDLATQQQDKIAQSQALQGLAMSLSYRGDHHAALDHAVRAESLVQHIDVRTELVNALWIQGFTRYRLGESRAALSLGEQAAALATELNDSNEMGRCLNLIGAAHYALGEYEQAENYWENALKTFQELGNKQQGMTMLNNLAAIADARGDHLMALQRYHSALDIAREIGNRDREILFLTNRGAEQVALGNYGAAEVDLRQAIESAGITGSWCMPIAFNDYAEALIGLGRYDEALYSAEQALFLSEEYKTPEYTGMAWRTLGMVSERLDKPISLRDRTTREIMEYNANACFDKSEKIFVEGEIDMERARTLREWATYKLKAGDHEAAKRMWQHAREIFAQLGADMEVQRMTDLPG